MQMCEDVEDADEDMEEYKCVRTWKDTDVGGHEDFELEKWKDVDV